ncbi:MAG: D-alanine--D-alanine ligase [Phycisphaerales bacterium JB058]
MTHVAVLGGGPDMEREVSIESSTAVAKALSDAGLKAELHIIDQLDNLAHIAGDVVFPVLHGRWGEGGPLQDILERDGRPYVGCGPLAARTCMDKIAAKLEAARLGIRTPPACLYNHNDRVAMEPPLVMKPALEGSSVGLSICRTPEDVDQAVAFAKQDLRTHPGQVTMVERLIKGREVSSPLIAKDGKLVALPLIEIAPAEGVYDYEAKYKRDDTVYTVDPGGIDAAPIQADTLKLAGAIGVRHLCRADYIIDEAGRHWLLEINTMPGFTSHSLVPQAARRTGMEMHDLCAHLVQEALTGAKGRSGALHSSETAP